MEGTLCSNMRVAAMGAIAAKYLAPEKSKIIGFIGAGEQAKMHLLAMKTVSPSLKECWVSAKTSEDEDQFISDLSPLLPEMSFFPTRGDGRSAMENADILVTATSAQAPLLKAAWMKVGSFYSHIGGFEDEYLVAKQCDKIVCDDWETVKHRTQTLSRMYAEGSLTDSDIYADLVEIVAGIKPGRVTAKERIYFNAVGLAYVDVALAFAMYLRAHEKGLGRKLTIQESMIFGHESLENFISM
jgi:ornithine cyclodeaminase/alanine dehydrogenase-like protein (mu-crystallin family)